MNLLKYSKNIIIITLVGHLLIVSKRVSMLIIALFLLVLNVVDYASDSEENNIKFLRNELYAVKR